MRLLLVSDLHYTLRQFDWLSAVASDFDVIVIAGDCVDVASAVPVEAQVTAIRATVARLSEVSRVLICSGNHDLNARSDAGEKTADWLADLRGPRAGVDGDTVAINGTTFSVLPWWDGPVAQAQVDLLLATTASAAPQRWVWVYHSPPEGKLSWTGTRHFGDPVVQSWIERYRPSMVLAGHIHQSPFTTEGSWIEHMGSTTLFNAGRQFGDVPSSIEIDLSAGRARWVSAASVQERALAQ